jgi:hypothetical protein
MPISRFRTPLLVAALAVTLAGCSGDHASNGLVMGDIEVRLTDAPIDISTVQSVNVTLTGVIVYPGDTGDPFDDMNQPPPIHLMSVPATFDLLTLTGGATALLASGEVPVGVYHRIRLEVSEATLVYNDGTTAPLKLDPGKVDVPIVFHVEEVGINPLTLDFDAAASVQVNETASDQLILRPVVTPIY